MQNQPQQNSLALPLPELEIPDKITCYSNPETSSYQCDFKVKNISNHIIYFNITSSFGKFLQINYSFYKLNGGETKEFNIRIRPPNQIYPEQFIGISYYTSQLESLCTFVGPDFKSKKIKLEFDTEIMEDKEIDQILKQQSQNVLTSARSFFQKAQYKNAKDTAQQAYTLYRNNLGCLILIAQAEIRLNEYEKADSNIEIFAYYQNHYLFYKAVILKAEILLNGLNSTDQPNKLQIIRHIMGMLKESTQKNLADETYQNKSNAVMAKLNEIKHKILSNVRDYQFEEILQKAVEKFDENPEIKSHFKDKEDFKRFLAKITSQQKQDSNETPEYALDPINYQIYKDPVITPSGLSYQRQFMINFFAKHGPQDPFTRHYLDPNSVFHNFTLKNLVRGNPNLAKWIKYQEQITKF